MKEQEKQRATHLMILFVYTIATIMLTGEALLLGWDRGAVVLLIIGLIASWVMHITSNVPDTIRLWLYLILTMLEFFYYGIHETSIYDLAPVMIVIILMYSATEMYSIIRLCVATYFLTMGYDLLFLLGSAMELSPLVVTRTLLHFLLVCVAARLVKVGIQRRNGERKETEEKIAELEEINRRTEDFLTNVSHELRTPINAVTGITAVMLKNEEDEKKRKDLASIQTAGHRLFGQIGDILDYTEIDTARITVSEDTYMISSLINDVIIENRLAHREHKLELIFDVDAGIPSVLLGDEKKIKKILGHLIDNAFKFTKRGGIYVRVYALRKAYGINLCIRVSDTGIGMTQEEVEKIRERFYQSNAGRNRRAGGLGLGLSIVYGMVSAMEGFLQIESAVGVGTTVSVSIPQKISDDTACMVVKNRQDLCLACYLRPEKYEVPQVRNYYGEMISNLVRELELSLHGVFNLDELKKLETMYRLTHLFIGKEEYEENESYFEGLNPHMKVIIVANEDFVLPQKSGAKLLKKPFYSLSVVNLLNAGTTEEETLFKDKYMICPGIRVLVVDDEPMNLMVAEGVFNDYQMKVTTAESGKKAIRICETEDFDLIFLDHMMPEMDGVETLKRIRKVYADTGRSGIIIAFTANAVSGAREMFLREGFDEFVSKPIETLEMERILRKVLPKAAIAYVDENYRKNRRAEKHKEKAAQTEEIPSEQIREKQVEEDEMSRLEKMGFQTSSGIRYCGDEEFYVEMLHKFAKDAKRKALEIDDSFQQEDLEKYGILVHALKSTAKMIGADALSEHARLAEEAAKIKDEDYIRQHHGELLAEYQQMVLFISEVFDLKETEPVAESEDEKSEISKEEMLLRLTDLKKTLDTFEEEKAEALISEMSGVNYQGESLEKLLATIRQDVEEFEFVAAAGKVDALIKNVEGGEVR